MGPAVRVHRVVSKLLGHVKRRAAARVLEVLLGARPEQPLDALDTPHAAGAQQRCVARAVHQVNRGLVVEQQPDLARAGLRMGLRVGLRMGLRVGLRMGVGVGLGVGLRVGR